MRNLKTKWGQLTASCVQEKPGSSNKDEIHIEHDGRLSDPDNYYKVHDVITGIRGVSVLKLTNTHLVLQVDGRRDLSVLSTTVLEALAAKAAHRGAPSTTRKEREQKPVKREPSRR